MGKLGVVMHDPTSPSHATPRQVAERYAVTVPTVFTWLRAGIIPAKVAMGRIYRFDLTDVDRALERQRHGIAAAETQTTNPTQNRENLV